MDCSQAVSASVANKMQSRSDAAELLVLSDFNAVVTVTSAESASAGQVDG